MSYSSPYYLFLFLPLVLLIYQLLPSRFRWLALLAASLSFYALGSGKLIVFIIISTLSIYIAGLFLERIQRRHGSAAPNEDRAARKLRKTKEKHLQHIVILIAVLVNFGLLAFLKYYNFFVSEDNLLISAFLHSAQKMSLRKLIIPMGISFYTLEAVAYVTEVARGKTAPEHNYFHLLLFLSFFPTVTEGPICSYADMHESLTAGAPITFERFRRGTLRLLWGCFMKITIADRAGMLVDNVFKQGDSAYGASILLAVLLYTLQLYADFAGCIDIAAGSAELFGIALPENFRQPFAAETVNDFWRRWHITLGAWFRDYVYYPLSLSRPMRRISDFCTRHFGMQRGAMVPTIIALLVTWLGTGLWHGASMKYVAYGLYYFLIILIEILVTDNGRKPGSSAPGAVWWRRARTFLLVSIGMMMFRADSMHSFITMLGHMFQGFSLKILTDGTIRTLGLTRKDVAILIFGIILISWIGHERLKGKEPADMVLQGSIPMAWTVYLCLIALVLIAGAYGPNYSPSDFLYAAY